MNLTKMGTDEMAPENPKNLMRLVGHSTGEDHSFFSETHFRHMLRIERMRTERSKKPFLLLLLDTSKLALKFRQSNALEMIKASLCAFFTGNRYHWLV